MGRVWHVVEVGVLGGAGVLGVGPSPPPEPSQVMPVGRGWHVVEVGVLVGAGVLGVGPSPPPEPCQVMPQSLPVAAPGS